MTKKIYAIMMKKMVKVKKNADFLLCLIVQYVEN